VSEDLEQRIRDECEPRIADLRRLREFAMPDPESLPGDVHASLLALRARLDLAEPVVQEITRIRVLVQMRARQAQASYEDAYDDELGKLGSTAVRREFEGVHDRETQARLKCLPVLRAARTAQRAADIAVAQEKAANDLLWGMLRIREELLTWLKYLPWETSMERG
jgi:hypothetical protein